MHSLVHWSNCVKIYRNVFSAIEFLIYKHNILNLFKGLRYNRNNLLQKYWICTFSGNSYSNSIYNVDKSINNAIEIQIHAQKYFDFRIYSTPLAKKCSSLRQRPYLHYIFFLVSTRLRYLKKLNSTKNPHVLFEMMLMCM